MDEHTLELLEFEKVRALVASRAACSLGKDSARRIAPSRDLGWIEEAQALVSEMSDALSTGFHPPFGGLRDVRAAVRRAKIEAVLSGEELAEILESLKAVANLDAWVNRVGSQFPRLGGLRGGIGEFSGLANTIGSCIDDRGNVLDTASRKLSGIRREIGQTEQSIQDTLRRMLRSNEIRRILRFPNFTMVGHHYVLPIAKDHRGEIQGSVHRTSASNETVYIEPQAVAEQSAQLSYLRAKEAKEIRRIFKWLSAQVGHVSEELLGTLETLAELDLVHAKARLSLEYRWTRPDMNREWKLSLRGARHPLLEALFRRDPSIVAPQPPADGAVAETGAEAAPIETRKVTSIDVHLGFRFQILVVTGPNTGGKTVALKTLGLLAIMAQSGLHVPANQGSQLPILDDVLADIGDEQSLEQSLSTFSSHMRRISQIVRMATAQSLVLLDELGAGTDPAEGAALGRAVLDELDSIGCGAAVTTHIGDLKTYAFTNPRAENAAVEFDAESMKPLYSIRIGDIGQSNALQIARRLDVPEHLVARAARYLEQGKGRELPEFELVMKLRKEAEAARVAALEAQAEAETSREAMRRKLEDLDRETENELKLIEARERLQIGDRVVVPRFGHDRPGRVVKLDPKKRSAAVSIGQMQWTVSIDELIPQVARGPAAAAPTVATKPAAKAKPGPRLEDFPSED